MQSADRTALLNKWFIRIAFSFWALFATLDYLIHQGFFLKAFNGTLHTAAIFVLLLFHAGFIYLHKKNAPDKTGITVKGITGWKIFLYLHFFLLVLLYSFGKAMLRILSESRN